MRNAPRSDGYGAETAAAEEAAPEAEEARPSEPAERWHAARLGEVDVMKPAHVESVTAAPIEDAWLAHVYEVQISDQGRVFSFLPPDQVRQAMETLVASEMLAMVLPRRR
jgi:predicted metal-dependent enzyme (double-stranded beta helix superfamily)